MSTANNASDRTLSIQRTFKAPIALVWEAWTQPGHIAKWWGPQGMEVQIVEHDFTVGGKWKYVMAMPDGSEFVSEGVFSEIVEGKKVVTSANFRPMTEGVELQALFTAAGEETHFTFHVVHPSADYAQQQEKMGFYNGWGGTFQRLDSYLGSL